MRIHEKQNARACPEDWETGFVDGTQLAKIMETHRNTIERWRDNGLIPRAAVRRWGHQVRYSLSVLETAGLIRRRGDSKASIAATTGLLEETVRSMTESAKEQLDGLLRVRAALKGTPPEVAYIGTPKEREP